MPIQINSFTNHPKTSAEIALMKNRLVNEISDIYSAKVIEDIDLFGYTWDADDQAIQNIMGVVIMINSGVSVPDPRPWTPTGSLTPVSLSHAQIIGLGAAIAARKDSLFVVKKTKQAEVMALTDVADIGAYDVNAGWS